MKRIEFGQEAEVIAFNEEVQSMPIPLRKYVRLVSEDRSRGYDIESVDHLKIETPLKVIEVKAWNKQGYFFISSNEIKVLKAMGDHAWIYLVDVSKKKIVKKIKNPIKELVNKIEATEFRLYY